MLIVKFAVPKLCNTQTESFLNKTRARSWVRVYC